MGCDFYITSPHKWLLAPKGTGTLYIREELQERLWVTLASGEWRNMLRRARLTLCRLRLCDLCVNSFFSSSYAASFIRKYYTIHSNLVPHHHSI